MISVRFQCKSFNIMIIQVYAPTSNAEEAKVERFYEDLLEHPENMSFSLQGTGMQKQEVKNTWSNRQTWPWSTELSRAKDNRVLLREHTGHSKHSLPTTQEKTLNIDISRQSTPKSDWLYSLQPKMEKLYIVSKNKTGS